MGTNFVWTNSDKFGIRPPLLLAGVLVDGTAGLNMDSWVSERAGGGHERASSGRGSPYIQELADIAFVRAFHVHELLAQVGLHISPL